MLFMEDALEGINSPLEYIYVKILRFALSSICFWPTELFNDSTWKISKYRGLTTLTTNIFTLVFNVAYLVAKQNTLGMLEIGHTVLTVFLTALVMLRSALLPLNPKYKKIILRYFTSIHLFHHAHKSEFSKQMHIRIHKISHLVTIFLYVQMIAGLTLFNIIPIYLNYSKGKLKQKNLENSTYELAVFLYIPKDATTNRNSYTMVALFDWYASYLCANSLCMNDLLLFLMIFHIYGHFKILLNLMATFPRPAATLNHLTNTKQEKNMFSEAELKEVYIRIKECIDYHNFLLEFTKSMSDAFGPMLFVYFTFHQVSCCLLLLECAQMSAEALIRYGPLTLIVFQALIQLSIIFELIGTVSGKLKDAIYELPWESMDLKNRKLVLFFLMNVQTPIQVKALGLTGVGVQTMATILKTSISYFTFLRTVPAD